MKFTRAARCLGAGIVVSLVSACGGGGGGGTVSTVTPPAPTPPQASLQVSGTAAVGAALANAPVQARCATGSGTATTAADGSYTVAIVGGALPCLVEVTGTVDGASVTLHSVADSGSTNAADAVTSARANATPLTELIVAQLTGTLPATSFSAFGSNSAADLAPAKVTAAADTMLAALKTAGVDAGTVDPLKGALAVGSGTTAGDAHDQLLDRFAARVDTRALPQLVNEIVVAGAAQASARSTTAAELVGGGTLAGCPTALSGRYRTIDYWGKTALRTIDFQAMKLLASDGVNMLDIVADPAKPCTFTATGTIAGRTSELSFVMGTQGVGIYRTRFVNPESPGTVGYLFPAQAHTLGDVAGTFSFLQSGYTPGQGTDTTAGQFTLTPTDGKLATCVYDRLANWACGSASTRTVAQRSDGGFDVPAAGSAVAAQVYAYRAPDGNVTLFGTTNPDSDNENPALTQTSIVAAKLQVLALPAVGNTEKYWQARFEQYRGVNSSEAPFSDMDTVTQVDAATGTVKFQTINALSFTQHFNQPLAGIITRDASQVSGAPAGAYQVALPGLGVMVSVNSLPSSETARVAYELKVVKP